MATEKAIQRATSRTPALEGRPALQQYIKQMNGEIKKALPSVMTPERFTRIVLSALSTIQRLLLTRYLDDHLAVLLDQEFLMALGVQVINPLA